MSPQVRALNLCDCDVHTRFFFKTQNQTISEIQTPQRKTEWNWIYKANWKPPSQRCKAVPETDVHSTQAEWCICQTFKFQVGMVPQELAALLRAVSVKLPFSFSKPGEGTFHSRIKHRLPSYLLTILRQTLHTFSRAQLISRNDLLPSVFLLQIKQCRNVYDWVVWISWPNHQSFFKPGLSRWTQGEGLGWHCCLFTVHQV